MEAEALQAPLVAVVQVVVVALTMAQTPVVLAHLVKEIRVALIMDTQAVEVAEQEVVAQTVAWGLNGRMLHVRQAHVDPHV